MAVAVMCASIEINAVCLSFRPVGPSLTFDSSAWYGGNFSSKRELCLTFCLELQAPTK